MEKKKNIIYLAWRDTYGVRREKEQWKKLFREKYGGENIEEVRIEEVKDWSRIVQDTQSIGLFATRRLWCLSGGFIAKKDTGTSESRKVKKWDGIEERILELVQSLDSDHFVLFSDLTFDSEKWVLIPWLKEYADTRISNDIWSLDLWGKRFPLVGSKAIKKVIESYKTTENGRESPNLLISDSIGRTLEKITLLDDPENPTEWEIDASLDLSYSGKIFDLTDAILALDLRKTRTLFARVLETTSPYELLPVLIGGLRNALYIKYLLNSGKKEKEIATLIQIHPYVLSKVVGSRISYPSLYAFQKRLINASIAYKSGRWLRETELWRIFSIDLALIWLQKWENLYNQWN